MYQTQQTIMTQKAILQSIRRQLLIPATEIKERLQTLGTKFCNKNYCVTGTSLLSPQ